MKHIRHGLSVAVFFSSFALAQGAAPVAAPDKPQTLEQADAQRERASAMRRAADEQHRIEQQACYQKFLVNKCLEEAKKRNVQANIEARKVDTPAREFQREARRADAAAKEAQRMADRRQREAEQKEKIANFHNEQINAAAEREKTLAAKEAQAAENRREAAAERAKLKVKQEKRAKKDADRAAKKAKAAAREEAKAKAREEATSGVAP